jgi:hypothetical protein
MAYRAEDDYDYLFKVVLMGDSEVGKSNLSRGSRATSSTSSPNQPLGSSSPPGASGSTTRSSRPRTPPGRRGTISIFYHPFSTLILSRFLGCSIRQVRLPISLPFLQRFRSVLYYNTELILLGLIVFDQIDSFILSDGCNKHSAFQFRF